MKPAIKSAIVLLSLIASAGFTSAAFGATVKVGDRAYSEIDTATRTTRADGKIELVSKTLRAGTITSINSDGTAQFDADVDAGQSPRRIMLMKSDIAKLKRAVTCQSLTGRQVYSTSQYFNQESEDKKLTDVGFANVKEIFGDCKTGIAIIEGQPGTPRQVMVSSLLTEATCKLSKGRAQVPGAGEGYVGEIYGTCESGKALFRADRNARRGLPAELVDVSQLVGLNASVGPASTSKPYQLSNSSSAAVKR